MAEPGDFERVFARVEALMRDWSLEDATRILEEVERAGGAPNRLRHDLSVLYAQQGFFDEALGRIEAALTIEPGNRALWHHFLATRKNDPVQPTAREWRAMHLAFGETVRDRHDERHLAVPRPDAVGRRLRVAYLCPDTHLATERFVWPVLEHFDPAALEVFAYWCHARDLTAAAAAYPRATHRSIAGLDDEAVVRAILADAIDVVVDIAGHGAGNVLPALARRPAPVACTWLDYLATTGMEEVDFRITDAGADPPEAELAHVERLIRLPGAQWCYRPPAGVGTEQPVWAAKSGGIVFGSASVPLKLADPLLDLWAKLLAAVPGSRLRFLGIPEGRSRGRVFERMAAGGIDGARLEFRPRLQADAFFRELAAMDVVLDSHPFSGATSTLDALWQGVPVVTLTGPLSHGRSTTSILSALGRPEWIADSPERFVEIAAGLARDEPRRARERSALRPLLQGSTLCDGPRFAAEMQAALKQAWEGRTQGVISPRDETVAFWKGLRAEPPAPRKRETLAQAAEVIDAAAGDVVEAIARTHSQWLLVLDTRHFDPGTLAPALPEGLLERADAFAALGSNRLVNGDIAAAGRGCVSGVDLVIEAAEQRLYASAWPDAGLQRCEAISGGALLARRDLLQRHWSLRQPRDAVAFACEVVRVSHLAFREGRRLGVAVALAVAARQWPDPRRIDEERRKLEQGLGIARWGQQAPSARPVKAVFRPPEWPMLVAGLEGRCDVA